MNGTMEKKKMSRGAKVGIGCGGGCLVIIIILGIVSFFGYRFVKEKLDEVVTEMQALGFEKKIQAQNIEIKESIIEPTLYVGQHVNILGDCDTDIAIIAQIAEIHGRVNGKLYFRGQVLTIQPKAVIMKGVDIKAQLLQNHGKVNGEISGDYLTEEPKEE